MMPEFPPFRLDTVNQCLWRRTHEAEDERILLTPKAFGVLSHLVDHAGQLVTHRQLLDAVWPQTAIEPQALKRNIFELRRALDDPPKKPRFIETLPKRGYRFIAKVGHRPAEISDAVTSPAATRLVGRDHELTELRQSLRYAGGGTRQIVFVTGEPGIGKTALVEELRRVAAEVDPPVRIAGGQCVEGLGSREAFYPVLEAIGQLCRGPDGSTPVETLATHAPPWLVQFPALLKREHRETLQQEILGATRDRMLREICEALETIALGASVMSRGTAAQRCSGSKGSPSSGAVGLRPAALNAAVSVRSRPTHSYRSASIGSRRAARRAGHTPKMRPVPVAIQNASTID